MVKAKTLSKPLKSSLKGKIVKRKIVIPTVKVKNKLKKLAVTLSVEPKVKPTESPKVLKNLKPKPEHKMQLRNKPVKEERQNYVLLKRVNNYDQMRKGVTALYELIEKSEKKTELFDEEQPIFLQVGCIKVPQTAIRLVHFNLKHTLVTESSEICLIVTDKGKRKDHDSTVEYYESILDKEGVTNIKTIMPFNQFKYEYGSQYELKRKLLGLYDFFLVDGRVSGHVNHLLGSIFYENRKMPLAVKMDKKLKENFDNTLRKTTMKIHSKGDSYAVQVGHTGMSQQQVFENITTIVEELNDLFPGGFDNVRFLGIKTNKSFCIPIYLTLKNNNTVDVPIPKPKLPKLYGTVKGELSTYLDASVTVTPEGNVVLKRDKIKIKQKSSALQPMKVEDADEEEEEADEGEEEAEENKKPELKGEKHVNTSDEDESDEENDYLAKEEEMYLNQYEHEQKEEENSVKRKQENEQKQPVKKVK